MYHYHFKSELKYYTLIIGLIILFGVFFKALEGGEVKPYQGYIKKYDGTLIKIVEAANITATPTPAQNGGLVFKDKYEEMIYKVFGEEYKIMYAIAMAESHLNPDKCHIDEREYSCGLFQINLRAHNLKIPGNTLEEKAEWLKDPMNNMITARFIKATSGLRAWSVYKNGVYKEFL